MLNLFRRSVHAARRIGLPVRVQMRADGQSSAFTWRGAVYREHGAVLIVWKLATGCWEPHANVSESTVSTWPQVIAAKRAQIVRYRA